MHSFGLCSQTLHSEFDYRILQWDELILNHPFVLDGFLLPFPRGDGSFLLVGGGVTKHFWIAHKTSVCLN